VRTDQNLARDSFRFSESWKKDGAQQSIDDRLEGFEVGEDGKVVVHSLSGNERNRLFMNRGGKEFDNASTISGLDNPADSRGWVRLDYDRDGWQDVAVINANAPLVNLYRNQIGEIGAAKSGMIAIRFEGGGGTGFACRDGYGAMVEVTLGDGMKLKREHRCGEGFSAQNSATMIIGIGENEQVSVKVRWPSGKTIEVDVVKEGSLLTAREDDEFTTSVVQKYREETPRKIVDTPKRTFPVANSATHKLQVYTTTATWCTACLGHLPALAQLKQDGVALYGVPIDVNDDAAKLAAYVEKKQPPYKMLAEISAEEKGKVNEFFAAELRMENPVLPSTVITDGEGNVLEVMQGIPTLSQVRKWKDGE
jgi:thiol-disulfide isomerase/thioredoxin